MSAVRSKAIRLLLVDDHQVVRVGLRTVLHNNQDITVVGEAGSKDAAVRAAKRLNPDIVLTDVRLPDGSGVEACRDILASDSTTRIIFLTSYADDDFVLAAVLAGAQGYVLKNIDSSLLVRSIRAVSNGQSLLNPALTQRALNWAKAGPAQAGPVRKTITCPSGRARLGVGGGRFDQQGNCDHDAT